MSAMDVDLDLNMNVNLGRGPRRSTSIQSSLLTCLEHLAEVAVMATTGGGHLLRLLTEWGSARRDDGGDPARPPGIGNGNGYSSGNRRENANGNGNDTGNGGMGNGSANGTGPGCECECGSGGRSRSESGIGTKSRNHRHHNRDCNQVRDTESHLLGDTRSPDEEDKRTRRRRAAGEGGDWYRGGNQKVQTRVLRLVSVVCGFAKDLTMYPHYSRGKFGEDAWFKTATPQVRKLLSFRYTVIKVLRYRF